MKAKEFETQGEKVNEVMGGRGQERDVVGKEAYEARWGEGRRGER